MEKLFNDSEVFQNERPTKATEEQLNNYLTEFAQAIIDSGASSSSIKNIIEDLQDISHDSNGYEIAKQLEDYSKKATYLIDSTFVEFLDTFDSGKDDLVRENVSAWVLAHDIKPKLVKGQKFIIKEPLYYKHDITKPFYITGFHESQGKYLYSTNKEMQGGTWMSYETLENENICTLIN